MTFSVDRSLPMKTSSVISHDSLVEAGDGVLCSVGRPLSDVHSLLVRLVTVPPEQVAQTDHEAYHGDCREHQKLEKVLKHHREQPQSARTVSGWTTEG